MHATLKHFVGLLGRRGRAATTRRCSAGPRELADVYLPPVRDGDPRGRGPVGDERLRRRSTACPSRRARSYLTGILRERWGFDGVVVADYFAVAFLQVDARCRGRPRRGRRAGARGRHRRRAADRRRLPAAAGRPRPSGRRRRGFRRPGRAASAGPEGGARPPRPRRLRGRAAHRHRPGPAASPGARPPAGGGVGRPAVEQRRAAAEPVGDRAGRASPSSARTPTARRRSWAATRSSTTCWPTTPSCRSASRSRRSPRPCGAAFDRAGMARPELVLAEGCSVEGEDTVGLRRRPCTPPRAPTWPSSSSATRPACSAAAPSVRATTPRPSSCPASSPARRGRRGDGHTRRDGAADRPALRGRLGPRRRRRAAGRRAAGVLPRRGRWLGDRRRRHRSREPVGSAPGLDAALDRRPAVLLPAPDARWAVRRDVDRLDAAAARSGSACRTRDSSTPTSSSTRRWRRAARSPPP